MRDKSITEAFDDLSEILWFSLCLFYPTNSILRYDQSLHRGGGMLGSLAVRAIINSKLFTDMQMGNLANEHNYEHNYFFFLFDFLYPFKPTW